MDFLLWAYSNLVNKSAKFLIVPYLDTLTVFAAISFLHLWYAIEWYFLFNVNSGIAVFWYTTSLSHYTLVKPSIGTPDIINLYLRLSDISVAVRMATHSAPTLLDLNVTCFLIYQCIGALLRKIRIPFILRRLNLSPAKSAEKTLRLWPNSL